MKSSSVGVGQESFLEAQRKRVVEHSLCFLVVGKQETPLAVLDTVQMCSRILIQYLQADIGENRTARALMCHMNITTDRNDQVKVKSEWRNVMEFCVENLIDIVAIPEHKLISPSITATLAFSMPYISGDITLLIGGNGSKSNLAYIPAKTLWKIVESFYSAPKLWLVVSKRRNFALLRRTVFIHCLTFAADGYTCRRIERLSQHMKLWRRSIWTLDASEPSDTLRTKLGSVFCAVDESPRNTDFLKFGSDLYELRAKPFEEYTFEDMIWMIELEVRIRGATVIPYF